MRLWLSHSSEISLREQLVTQIRLGIISGDLSARQKLPSTRELARRFHIHANTVSAAYRELHRGGWVEFRKGSGVYVRKLDSEMRLGGSDKLDQLIAQFFSAARQNGFSLNDIRKNLSPWLNLQTPDHLLVIEPDTELRRILTAEIEAGTETRVRGTGIDDWQDSVLEGAAPVAMYSQAQTVRALLPPGIECLLLHSTSVVERLQGEQAPPRDTLLALVSRWPRFLELARAILIAAGIDPEAMDLRDARRTSWKKGLSAASLVITDSLIASQFPDLRNARVVRLISDASLTELRAYVEQYLAP